MDESVDPIERGDGRDGRRPSTIAAGSYMLSSRDFSQSFLVPRGPDLKGIKRLRCAK
jgi:hypothetical protein